MIINKNKLQLKDLNFIDLFCGIGGFDDTRGTLFFIHKVRLSTIIRVKCIVRRVVRVCLL